MATARSTEPEPAAEDVEVRFALFEPGMHVLT